MPTRQTIGNELHRNEAFFTQYQRACARRGQFYGDKVIEVADGVLAGEIDPSAGKVAIDAYKWTASKLDPKTYGDHSQVDVNANVKLSAADNAPGWLKDRLASRRTIDVEAERVEESDTGDEAPNTVKRLLPSTSAQPDG